MSDAAIVASGLSKRYRIGEKRAGYKTLRDTISNFAAAAWRRKPSAEAAGASAPDNTIWALRDVSFEIHPGEVVGVIGRNGAGKSTLLKVLSRITEPTEGTAVIRGRVGSLLEVGTGFHPELTGRENMYLNGAILGMRRREMNRKLDEIVDFAEISRFIDTPVKFYSSGMYLRLAFSVAAHLETEILLVDEILAVGDVRFQKRCLGKMESVAAEGRTVLFVSHTLAVLKELCQTALVLENGTPAFRGRIAEGLVFYSHLLNSTEEAPACGTGWRRVRINDGEAGIEPVLSAAPFVASAVLDVEEDLTGAHLYCDRGVDGASRLPAGRYEIRVDVPTLWLFPDVYSLYFKLSARPPSGVHEKRHSPRVVLNISDRSGQAAARVKTALIPPLQWWIVETAGSASSDDAEIDRPVTRKA
jgi:lipopolysaccharide transport system ATP-binding protein